jgi:hypothetical protein
MGKATVRRATHKKGSDPCVDFILISARLRTICLCSERPRWRILPPEIVHIIVKMLGTDKESLSSCALVSRDFTFAALCRLGRHISINTVRRLRECARLLANASAFQHVRSLDLGITTKKTIHQKDWDDYLIVLEAFARRHTLNRLWFSEVPFYFSKRGNQERFGNIISSLTTTVNELGLYSCHFSSYEEMISFIRAFPLCASLYVRDCVAQRNPAELNAFVRLPRYTLHINDLELTSSSKHKHLFDVSNLVKDAALDVSSLTGFTCEMSAADAVQQALMITAASPIEKLQLACDEAEGFHGTSSSIEKSFAFP